MTKAVTGGRVRLATMAAGVELVTPIIAAAMTSATIMPVWAQDISINFGQGGGLTERVLQLVALMTVLSISELKRAPSKSDFSCFYPSWLSTSWLPRC